MSAAKKPLNQPPQLARVTLSQSAQKPVLDYVLPGLLAGSVGLIIGQGAVGKSMLSLGVGLGVASGREIAGLGKPESSGPVTIVAGEDPDCILQERLYWLRAAHHIDDAVAAALDERLTIYSGSGVDLRIMAQRDRRVDWLGVDGFEGPFHQQLIEIAKGQRLVILDPLAFLSDCDENDNPSMTRLMVLLQGVCRATRATIIVLHHVSKAGSQEGGWTAARGASSITTAARWQASLMPAKKEELELAGYADAAEQLGIWVRFVVDKINYGERPKPSLLQRGLGGVLVTPPPGTPPSPKELSERNVSKSGRVLKAVEEGKAAASFDEAQPGVEYDCPMF